MALSLLVNSVTEVVYLLVKSVTGVEVCLLVYPVRGAVL